MGCVRPYGGARVLDLPLKPREPPRRREVDVPELWSTADWSPIVPTTRASGASSIHQRVQQTWTPKRSIGTGM